MFSATHIILSDNALVAVTLPIKCSYHGSANWYQCMQMLSFPGTLLSVHARFSSQYFQCFHEKDKLPKQKTGKRKEHNLVYDRQSAC